MNLDPQGHERTVPVRFNDGPHTGLVVMHSVEEAARSRGSRIAPWGHGLVRVRTCPDCRPPGQRGFGGTIGWPEADVGPERTACECDPPKVLEDVLAAEAAARDPRRRPVDPNECQETCG